MTIRVLQVGLGPIGVGVLRQVIDRPGFELAGAVDIDPAKAGKDVGEACGLGRSLGITVEADLAAAVARDGIDVAVLCTGSALERVLPQFETVLASGLPVVSTTEELAFPQFAAPELTARLDAAAKEGGAAILGTGVNPGFAMDLLPIALTAPCERVDAVRIDRIQDASKRRIPFQVKIGSGMDPDDFRAKVDRGEMGHVGFTESVAMLAAAFGWKMDRITDSIEPKVAEAPTESGLGTIGPGKVIGIIQDAVGYRDGETPIRLHMEAYLGAPESYDEVRIEGSPSLRSRLEGGFPGDIATASIVVNCLPRILQAPPGLITMKDLPVAGWWSGEGS
ncbi:MAG: dihydrodipicolinate reductase [Acidobacteria bacterium]|nr:dihydrodipicolinate reductase [Acidobacteriota bacterium]